jgi:hypothetical protein
MQPYDSGTCAFAAAAMVIGCSIDEAIAASGRRGSSDGISLWAPVRRALDRHGVRYGKLVSRTSVAIPDFCIAYLSDAKNVNLKTDWGHAVAVLDGIVYDPSIGCPLPVRVFEDFIIEGRYSLKGRRYSKAHWASFLPILSEPPTPSRGAPSTPGSLARFPSVEAP